MRAVVQVLHAAHVLQEMLRRFRHPPGTRERMTGVKQLGGGRAAQAIGSPQKQPGFEHIRIQGVAARGDKRVAFTPERHRLIETGSSRNRHANVHVSLPYTWSATGRQPSEAGICSSSNGPLRLAAWRRSE